MNEGIGTVLRNLRKRKRYSQTELAAIIGISRSGYSHYETGRNHPPIEMLIQLSGIYQISYTDLLDLSYSKPEKPTNESKNSLEKIQHKFPLLPEEASELCFIFEKLTIQERESLFRYLRKYTSD